MILKMNEEYKTQIRLYSMYFMFWTNEKATIDSRPILITYIYCIFPFDKVIFLFLLPRFFSVIKFFRIVQES